MSRARKLLLLIFDKGSKTAAGLSVFIGIIVLIGWALDLPTLKSVFPGIVTMKANTALGFVLSGISLWTASEVVQNSLKRYTSLLCSFGVISLGLFTVIEYMSGVDLGIDQLLIREITTLPGDIPGRMAVNTAINFMFSGTALILSQWTKVGFIIVINILAASIILVAGTTFIGYAYHIESFLRVSLSYTPMALHTALAFLFLGLGIISMKPEFPIRRVMLSEGPAGSMARALIPFVIAFPFTTGWLIHKGYDAGYYTEAVGFALFAATTAVVISGLIQWNVGWLHDADRRRSAAEKDLREGEQRMHQLLDNLPAAVVVHRPDTTIRYANSAASKILGLTGDQLLGRTALDPYWHFIRGDGSLMPLDEYPVNQVVRDAKPLLDFLAGIVKTEGARPVWVYVNAFPDFDISGKMRDIIVSFMDFTERKLLEEEVRNHRDNLEELVRQRSGELERVRRQNELILRSTVDGIFMLDPGGKITFINPAAERMLGFAPGELTGRNSHAAFHHSRENGSPFSIEDCLTYKSLLKGETLSGKRDYFWRKNGTGFPVDYTSTPIVEQEKIIGVVVVFRDVTETKRSEEEIMSLNEMLRIRVSELERANSELSNFSYNVSHDLRAPLRAISGFTSILLEDYYRLLDDEGRRLVGVIRDNAHRMGELVDGLVDYLKLTLKDINYVDIDMVGLVKEIFQELRSAEPHRMVELKLEPLPTARGDGTMIHQVLYNLLSNAFKFTRPKEKGVIEVGAESAEDKGENLYYVRDNGVGFDMAYIDKLFGVFQKLHGYDEFKGTGIGLALVERIINRHGGRVWAEGKVGEGAVFYFTLPKVGD